MTSNSSLTSWMILVVSSTAAVFAIIIALVCRRCRYLFKQIQLAKKMRKSTGKYSLQNLVERLSKQGHTAFVWSAETANKQFVRMYSASFDTIVPPTATGNVPAPETLPRISPSQYTDIKAHDFCGDGQQQTENENVAVTPIIRRKLECWTDNGNHDSCANEGQHVAEMMKMSWIQICKSHNTLMPTSLKQDTDSTRYLHLPNKWEQRPQSW